MGKSFYLLYLFIHPTQLCVTLKEFRSVSKTLRFSLVNCGIFKMANAKIAPGEMTFDKGMAAADLASKHQ